MTPWLFRVTARSEREHAFYVQRNLEPWAAFHAARHLLDDPMYSDIRVELEVSDAVC